MTIDIYESMQDEFERHRRASKPVPTGANVSISDHAMLRYLERACGIEADAMREMIAGILSPLISAPNVQIVHNGIRYVVRNRVLVTLYPECAPDKHQRGRGR